MALLLDRTVHPSASVSRLENAVDLREHSQYVTYGVSVLAQSAAQWMTQKREAALAREADEEAKRAVLS